MKGDRGLVLIGFAEALAAPEAAWSLLDAGFRVAAFTRSGRRRPVLGRARNVELLVVTAPERDAHATARDVAAAAVRLGAVAVLPLDDAAVWVADAQEHAIPIAGPTGALSALSLDKRLQLDIARRAGFDVPATKVIASWTDTQEPGPFPLVFKPAVAVSEREGRLVRGTGHVCDGPDELERALVTWDGQTPMLAQPYVTGVGEGVFGIAGRRGVHALSAHRRVRMANPQGSGSSACTPIPVDPQLVQTVERFLEASRWRGIFMLELLRDDSGRAWFMELNGRTWGSTALARRQGLEYPAWALELALDPLWEPEDAREGPPASILCRHAGREIVHLLSVMRGPRSRALGGWPGRAQTAREVLRIGRRDRWYNLRRGEWRLFLEDSYRSVADEVWKQPR